MPVDRGADPPSHEQPISESDLLQGQIQALTKERRQLRNKLRKRREEITELTALNSESDARVAALAAGTDGSDKLGYVFIVTYGRSGSTLLQGLMTSLPGYLIRGENGGALYEFYQLHTELAALRDKHGHTAFVRNAWYGIGGYADDVAYAAIRRWALTTLLRPDADTRVVGFKEIRWPEDDLTDYVTFLRQVFPGARFVINTRDHAEVSQSKWWAKDPDALTVLVETEQRLLALADQLGDGAFHLHYNDYVDDPDGLRPLFGWLGAPYDAEAVRAIMEVRHSY